LNPASGGDDCFQLDSEEHAGGFGIRFFHNPLVLSRAAALSPSVLNTIFFTIFRAVFMLAWFMARSPRVPVSSFIGRGNSRAAGSHKKRSARLVWG